MCSICKKLDRQKRKKACFSSYGFKLTIVVKLLDFPPENKRNVHFWCRTVRCVWSTAEDRSAECSSRCCMWSGLQPAHTAAHTWRSSATARSALSATTFTRHNHCVQLLATEPSLRTNLRYCWCSAVEQSTTRHYRMWHSTTVSSHDSKHSCSDGHTHLLCFSLLWLAVCRGPCGFYLGHVKNPQCNVM